MRVKDIIGLILALILAVGVAFLTRIFLTKEEKPKQEVATIQEPLARVLVAGRSLAQGDTIKPGDLVWQEWPKKAVTPTDMTEETTRPEEFMGAVVRFPIPQGTPVVRSELIKKGDKGFLAAVVSPGKRAISIDVTPSSSDSGLIFPGDYVDVILSGTKSEKNEQIGRSKTILREVKVLAFDSGIAAPTTNPKTPPHVATLEVTPPQAEILMAASKEGTLALSLHGIENGPVEVRKADVKPVEKPNQEKKIILMRGKDKSEIQFQEK